jgi:hypothetical protein
MSEEELRGDLGQLPADVSQKMSICTGMYKNVHRHGHMQQVRAHKLGLGRLHVPIVVYIHRSYTLTVCAVLFISSLHEDIQIIQTYR